MSRKNFLTSCYLIALVSLSSVSFASSDDLKVAVFDRGKIIDSSLAYSEILKQVQKKQEEFKNGIQKSEGELKKKYQDLEAKKNALSEKAMSEKNDEINNEVADLQRRSYEQYRAIEDAHRNATESLFDKTSEIVQSQAKQQGYQLVVDKAAAVYTDTSLDITDKILAELNKTTPTLEVKFVEQGKKVKEKAQNLKERVSEKGEEIKGKAGEKAQELKGRASEKADELGEKTKEKAKDLKEKTKEKGEEMKERAGEKSEELREKAGEKVKELGDKFKEKNK